MKTLGLVLAMVALVGGACFAATTQSVTVNVIGADWNMISLPCVPIDPAVGGNQTGQDANGVFGAYNTKGAFTLKSWNPANGSYVTFKGTLPAGFGGILLGQGYWLTGAAVTGNITYTACLDGVPDINSAGAAVTDSAGFPVCTDMYLSLPGGGQGTGAWHLIGHPFNHTTLFNVGAVKDGARIQITDGTNVYGFKDAVTNGWVAAILKVWSPVSGSYSNVGFSQIQNSLKAGNAYWIQTLKDNLAMIIPGMEVGQ